MQRQLLWVFLLAAVAGCQFRQPDYVTMVDAAALQRLLSQGDIFLVDVHVPEQRHIKGTDLFVPYDRIVSEQHRFPQDKQQPIYIYCESGPMGNAAARTLYTLGYSRLFNLAGGALAWGKAGYAFE